VLRKRSAEILHLGLKGKLKSNEVKLNLIAGTKSNVRDYFLEVKKETGAGDESINIVYSEDMFTYFRLFNEVMRDTDILWTKPSELTFYSGLGIPIIIAPSIGSQEKFNAIWLREIGAGIKQLNPEYLNEWLFDYLNKGLLAEAAWSGFLKVRKLGTYKILEVLETGRIKREESPILR
jgi:hypothetical protein